MKTFGRRASFQIQDRVIKYPDIYMEFEIKFDTDSEGNVGSIKFYNLADTTINLMKRDQAFTLKAGYKGDIGLLLPGVIASSSTSWESANKITELIIGDNTDTWLTATINQTWRAGIKSSTIVNDIINKLPLEVGEISLTEDIIYPKGKTFSTTKKKALEEEAADTGSKLHISRGRIYIRPPAQGTKETIVLNKDTGLISIPQKLNDASKEGYKIQSLLNYRIWNDSILEINSKTINGAYRVENGSHRLSGNDFITEAEVVKI